MAAKVKLSGYELTVKLRKARRRYPLTATDQALFYQVVALCSEMDWDEMFSCSNASLCHVLSIVENTLITARTGLMKAELISYSSGKSRQLSGTCSFTNKLTNDSPPKTTLSKAAVVEQKTTSKYEVDDEGGYVGKWRYRSCSQTCRLNKTET